MPKQILKTPRWSYYARAGTEGPMHDPWHFDEYEALERATGHHVRIHLGLAIWLEIDGGRVDFDEFKDAIEIFKVETGLSPDEIERYIWKRDAASYRAMSKEERAAYDQAQAFDDMMLRSAY